jgi:hypothetical protein
MFPLCAYWIRSWARPIPTLKFKGKKVSGKKVGKRFQEPFFARPRFRIVLSSPNFATAFDTHFSEP